jgi:hypothetical protein
MQFEVVISLGGGVLVYVTLMPRIIMHISSLHSLTLNVV